MNTPLKRTGLAGLTAAGLAAPVLRAEITSWEPNRRENIQNR